MIPSNQKVELTTYQNGPLGALGAAHIGNPKVMLRITRCKNGTLVIISPPLP